MPRLTEKQLEALRYFNALARDDRLRMDMDLEPGDIQLLSNHSNLHMRTAFRDEGVRSHCLLRLTLHPPCLLQGEHRWIEQESARLFMSEPLSIDSSLHVRTAFWRGRVGPCCNLCPMPHSSCGVSFETLGPWGCSAFWLPVLRWLAMRPALADHLEARAHACSRALCRRWRLVSLLSRLVVQNWEERRHLLRLWISPPHDRPLPEEFAALWGSIKPGNRGGARRHGQHTSHSTGGRVAGCL